MDADDPHPIYITEPRGLIGVAQRVEATASLVAVVLLVGTVVIVSGTVVFMAAGRPTFIPLFVGWLAVAAAQFGFLRWLKTERDLATDPFIPHLAMRQLSWPLPLRPVASAFWLAHFSVTSGFLVVFEHVLLPTGREWVNVLPLALVMWVMTHCSLMFLFLAVTAIHKSQRLVDVLWRGRLLIDLAVTGGALLLMGR